MFKIGPVFNRCHSRVPLTGLSQRHIWAEDAGPPRCRCPMCDVGSKARSLAQRHHGVQRLHRGVAHIDGQMSRVCEEEMMMIMMIMTVMIREGWWKRRNFAQLSLQMWV